MKGQVERICQHIRAVGTYIPRGYQSIGSMWAVDTWEHNGIKAQLLDEGYTWQVVTDDLIAYETAYGVETQFNKGGWDELNALEAKEILGR